MSAGPTSPLSCLTWPPCPVFQVLERGLVMTGYSDLSGFVPAAFAGSALDDFFPGQIVQCAVSDAEWLGGYLGRAYSRCQ